MNITTVPQQKSIASMTRLSADLDERVMRLIRKRGYRSKSNFLEEAARFYVELLENQEPARLPVQTPMIQN